MIMTAVVTIIAAVSVGCTTTTTATVYNCVHDYYKPTLFVLGPTFFVHAARASKQASKHPDNMI